MGSNSTGQQSYTTYIVGDQEMMTDVEAALGVDAHSLGSSSSSSVPSLVSGQVINLATASSPGNSSSSTGMLPAAAEGASSLTEAPLQQSQSPHRVVVVVNSSGTPVGTAVLDNSGRMVALNADGLAAGSAEGEVVNMAVPQCNSSQQQQILLVTEDTPTNNSSSNTTVTVTGETAGLQPGDIVSADALLPSSSNFVINGEYTPSEGDTPDPRRGSGDAPVLRRGPAPKARARRTVRSTGAAAKSGLRGSQENTQKRQSCSVSPSPTQYTPTSVHPNTHYTYMSSSSTQYTPQPTTAPQYTPQPTTAPQYAPQPTTAPQYTPQPTMTTTAHYIVTPGGPSTHQGDVQEKDPHPDGKDGVKSIPHHGMDEFLHHHHLTKSQVEGLFMILGPHYTNPGRRAPLKDFVLASLVLLSSKDSYREMSEQMVFKSRGWMHKTIHLFCNLMVKHLSCLVEWPSGDAAEDTVRQFQDIAGVPGVIGAMGTCHMAITKAPAGKSSSFYSNSMQFHSIHLLAVSDHRSRFTYVNVGRPGSLHESKVYQGSSLCQIIENEPHVIFPPNTHIIASAAFPLNDRILTPYPNSSSSMGSDSRTHMEFSSRLLRTRRPLDMAFQLLRSKWQRLKCLEMQHVTSMSVAIKTCCILHNICMHNDSYKAALGVGAADEEAEKFVEVEYVGLHPLSAIQKRDLIAHHVEREAMVS